MTQPSISDTDLLKAAKRGDQDSLVQLFERYRPRLYAAALKYLGHIHHAKDAVQDTFLTVLTKIHQLREEEAYKGWLFTVLRNHCRMYHRKDRSVFTEKDLAGPIPDQPVDPASVENLESLQRREAILKALSRLPEKQRAPLLLRYFSQFYTYETIAKLLALPVGTVRSRLSRAKKKLLKEFKSQKRLEKTGRYLLRERRAARYKDAIRQFYRGRRERLLQHFAPDLRIRFTSGQEKTGLEYWTSEWEEDLESGVRFQPNEVLSSGSLTIIEGVFKNPPHDPYHCPPGGAFVFFHAGEKVGRVHIHYGERIKASKQENARFFSKNGTSRPAQASFYKTFEL